MNLIAYEIKSVFTANLHRPKFLDQKKKIFELWDFYIFLFSSHLLKYNEKKKKNYNAFMITYKDY